jgi:thiamine biosynthesis lipoprotein
MKIRPLYLLLIFLLLLIGFEAVYSNFIFSAEKIAYLMGTPVRVKVFGSNSPHLAMRALWEIRRLDRLFSKFDPKSEVSLLNQLAGRAPLEVSADTFECVKMAAQVNKLSRGAFDITLGHPRALVLYPGTRKLFIKRRGVTMDLGGIGKGYAVESARKLLLKKGARSGMIDMHSSIAVFGLPAGRQGHKTWKVAIQHPRQKEKLIGVVELRDGDSLATSGDYERGKHILDPRTGKPPQGCQAVTIIGKDAALCDALSTAVFVLGPGAGMELIEVMPGIEGLVVDAKGGVLRSSGFVMEKP